MKIFGTDHDGIIINIEPRKAVAFGELINREWGININEGFLRWMQELGTSRRSKFDYFYERQFNNKLTDQIYKEIEEKFSDLLKTEFYPTVNLLPGAIDLVKFVRSSFDFTFVSSGVPMDEMKQLVEKEGLSSYYDLVLGTNDKYLSKRDHFKKIIKEKNPDLVVFIADGLEDMKICKEFGITSIGVSTNHTKEELLDAGASMVCGNLKEAKILIESLISH
jgi:phosphoglycolate phosphatase-like HAD superfamily hydrolase